MKKRGNPWHSVALGDSFPREIKVVIEIPKGTSDKYELDKRTGKLRLDRKLSNEFKYPGDYGFFPKTLFFDKDPMDLIVLTRRKTKKCSIKEIRIIGLIRMIDTKERDDKVIAVYPGEKAFDSYRKVSDVPKKTLDELGNFFSKYKEVEGKHCEILRILSKNAAHKELRESRKRYEKKFRKDI